MRQMSRLLSYGALLLLLGVTGVGETADGDREASEMCAVCHDTVAEEFNQTIHAPNRANAPSCVTCHGDGAEHMENDGDPAFMDVPRGASAAATCMQCHGQIQTMFSNRSAHADSGVHCDSCHAVHSTDQAQPMQLAKAANQLCADCHSSETSSFKKPFGHDLDRGGLQCISCHNPQAAAAMRASRSIVRARLSAFRAMPRREGPSSILT